MPEIAAFSLPTALMPAAVAPLENASIPAESGTAAGTTPPAPSFDALLALQTAAGAATDQTATALLPESGKALPDEPSAVAARTQANLTANLPKALLLKSGTAGLTANRADATATPAQTLEAADEALDFETDAEIAPLRDMALPDIALPNIALFAAIFAAPERLANGPSDQPVTPPLTPPSLAATTAIAIAAPAPATPAAVAAAIASTAQIELAPPAQKGATARVAPMTTQVPTTSAEGPSEAAPALANQTYTTPVVPPLRALPAATSAEPTGDGTADARVQAAPAAASETFTPQLAESTMPSTIAADAAVQTDAAAAAAPLRSEARAERIDFATLVDTLNRAREEASPRTLNVAVTNTDFGRVSMRFDSTDAGLSVAMSAADPGFVRAVHASGEAASANADTRGQNGQPQADASAARQQQMGQQHMGQQQGQPSPQQQAAAARSDTRPSAKAAPNSRRDNDAASGSATSGDSGIYA